MSINSSFIWSSNFHIRCAKTLDLGFNPFSTEKNENKIFEIPIIPQTLNIT